MRTLVFLLLCTLLSACATSQWASQPTPIIPATAFRAVAGESKSWKGTLTYRNYADGQSVSIPSNLRLERKPPAGPPTTLAIYDWMTGYDEAPHANSAATFAIVQGGRALQNGDTTEPIVAYASTPTLDDAAQATRVIITQFVGQDDSRPATIRKIYTLSPRTFSVQKLVRYDDARAAMFFERHIYRWSQE